MTITNIKNLPQALVQAVSTAPHNENGCYSATTLNKGTKEIILTKRHWNELQDDAADRIWATFGTAVHALLENQKDNCFHEEKFSVAVSDSKVTGQVDSYDMETATINDWKTASVWKVQFADFSDWYSQGMTYAWLMTQQGLEVRHCRFVALLKDHSKSKARTDRAYPQSPVYIYSFDVIGEELAEAGKRIEAKVHDIENAELLEDDLIEPCSPEERWADADKYAVMKEGRKTAVKLFESIDEAQTYANEHGKGYFVEHRPATNRKCEDYCVCKQFCNFYKQLHK